MIKRNKEDAFRKVLLNRMKGHWEATRIESGTVKGIPDLFFSIPQNSGWMELKVIDDFPVKDNTNVSIDHLYQEQKDWIKTNGRIGGNVWLLVYVRSIRKQYLFPWWVVEHIGEYTAKEWSCAAHVFPSPLDPMALYEKLLAGCPGKLARSKGRVTPRR